MLAFIRDICGEIKQVPLQNESYLKAYLCLVRFKDVASILGQLWELGVNVYSFSLHVKRDFKTSDERVLKDVCVIFVAFLPSKHLSMKIRWILQRKVLYTFTSTKGQREGGEPLCDPVKWPPASTTEIQDALNDCEETLQNTRAELGVAT